MLAADDEPEAWELLHAQLMADAKSTRQAVEAHTPATNLTRWLKASRCWKGSPAACGSSGARGSFRRRESEPPSPVFLHDGGESTGRVGHWCALGSNRNALGSRT